MTPFEHWILTTTKAMVGTMREDCEPDWSAAADEEERMGYMKTYNEMWDLLERRIAITLVQSRALECRQIAGSVLIHRPQNVRDWALGLSDRSSKLEKMGMEMCEPSGWPPSEEEPAVEPGPRLIVQ